MMQISLVQLDIKYESYEQNMESVQKYIIEASQKGSDIIFFPEMTFTGFSMNVEKNAELCKNTIERVKEMAYGRIAVGFGWVKQTEEKGENHYTVISPDGTVLADYVKMHPFSYSGEDKYYNAGSKLSSFIYCGKKISIFICYDLRFPEIFQAASKDSEVIVVAANWPERRSDHWKTLLKARAIENQSWILGVNCYGNQQELHYSGDSSIIMPDGTIEAAINNAEGMISVVIGDEMETARNNFPIKHDRRTELYKKLYKGSEEK